MNEAGLGIQISEATTDQLIDELGRRHKGVVVLMCSDVPRQASKESSGMVWRGGATQAYGLLCKHKLVADAEVRQGNM